AGGVVGGMTPGTGDVPGGVGGIVGCTPPGDVNGGPGTPPGDIFGGFCVPVAGGGGPAAVGGAPGGGGGCARRGGDSWGGPRRAREADVLLRADVDVADVFRGELVIAHNVRRDQHDDVRVLIVVLVVGEHLAEDRHVREPGNPGPCVRLILPDQPGEQARLPL